MPVEQQTRVQRTFYLDGDGYDSIDKRVDEVADYKIDLADNLDSGDTITGTPTWTVPAGITKDSQSNDTTSVTIWLSGGTAGASYVIECQITTAQGRTKDRRLRVYIR